MIGNYFGINKKFEEKKLLEINLLLSLPSKSSLLHICEELFDNLFFNEVSLDYIRLSDEDVDLSN